MAPSKQRLVIPRELLRRSCRNISKQKSTDTQEPTEQSRPTKKIKKEPREENSEATRVHLDSKCVNDNKPKCPDGHLEVHRAELDLERTLLGGQSFRWTKSAPDCESHVIFTGVVGQLALQLWRPDDHRIAFKVLQANNATDRSPATLISHLEDYFQLKFNLKQLYAQWSARDEHLAKYCKDYTGFRILRQDPVENVFSFICATNNNIKRISLMIDKLCQRFGERIQQDCKEPQIDKFSTFPSVDRLAQDDVHDCLRHELGFGYRAKFITGTAKLIIELSHKEGLDSPRDYLMSLRSLPYKETCKTLMKFPGIGRKVADCICLMSMDHLNSVPIDCHIYEVVCRYYMKNLRQERKTLTEIVHDLIGDYFNDLHGPLAGWSTSVLFISELRHLRQNTGDKEHEKDKEITESEKKLVPKVKRIPRSAKG